MSKITVLLADDHAVVRQGLRAILETTPDIEVIGEADTGRAAVRMALTLQPQVVVMDLSMPELNGAEATRQILRETPSARVLVLSMYGDDEAVRQLMDRGAIGYLVKQAGPDDLVKAIRTARKGNPFFSSCISKDLQDQARAAREPGGATSKQPRRPGRLTAREAEVLQLIAEGYVNKQIANVLGISIKTVEKHRHRVVAKLKINGVAALTRYAITHRLIFTLPPVPGIPLKIEADR